LFRNLCGSSSNSLISNWCGAKTRHGVKMPASTALVHIGNNRELGRPEPLAFGQEWRHGRVWFEPLEPRVLFSGVAAALTLDPRFGQGGFAPVPEPGAIGVDGVISIVPAANGSFYALSDQTPGTSGSIIRYGPPMVPSIPLLEPVGFSPSPHQRPLHLSSPGLLSSAPISLSSLMARF
jgi:hypothetical protein